MYMAGDKKWDQDDEKKKTSVNTEDEIKMVDTPHEKKELKKKEVKVDDELNLDDGAGQEEELGSETE